MKKIVLILILVMCCIFLMLKTTTIKAETNPEKFVELNSLEGHTNSIFDLEFSPNGKYFASCSYDKTIKIWNSSSWNVIKTLILDDRVFSVAISPNSSYLASGTDKELILWNTTTWEEIKSVSSFRVWSVAFSLDGKYLVSNNHKNIYLWNTTTFTIFKTLTGHTDDVKSLAFSPDTNYLISSSNDNTIKIWNTTNWQNIKNLTAHTDEVTSVSFSPNGTYLASVSIDKTLKIWNTTNWEMMENLTANSTEFYSVAFSPDNKYLAIGSSDNSAKIWNTTNWNIIKNLTYNARYVYAVTFSPDTNYLASGGNGRTIKIWNTTNWIDFKNLTGHYSAVKSLSFSSDGNLMASGSNEIKIWNTTNWNNIKTLSDVSRAAFSPSSSYLATGQSNGVNIWNTTTWEIIIDLGGPNSIYCVAFSQDGNYLVAGVWGKIKIWNTTTWENIENLTDSTYIYSIAFSPDGKYLASTSGTDTRIWDTTSWENIINLTGHSQTVNNIRFSPDGKYLASGSKDRTVKIWNTTTWSNIITLDNYSFEVESVAFSPDSNYLAVGLMSKIKICNTTTWANIKVLTGLSQKIYTLAFSPDGKYLASGSQFKRIKIWGEQTDLPDLSIYKNNITFSKEKIFEEEIVTIFAKIQNIGVKVAKNFNVTFFIDKRPISSMKISRLEPNSTKVISLDWRAVKGTHEISVEIIPEDYLFDIKDENNIAEKTVEVHLCYLPNLTTVETTKSINPGEFLKYDFSVENLGGKDDIIYLSFSSTKTWVCYLNRTVILLNPNESANATLTIIPSGDTIAEESAEINITAISGGNSSRNYSITFTTLINQIYDISISANQTEYHLNPAQTLNLNLSLYNLGNGNDTFKISLNKTVSKNIDNWEIYPENIVKKLDISEIDYLYFYITPPESALANSNAEIVFDAKSIYNENLTLDTITIKIIINHIHNIHLEAETTQQSAKPGEIVNTPVKVINNGNGEETVTFQLSGENSNWGYLDQELPYLTLGIDNNKEIDLNILIPHDATPDEKAEVELSAFVGDELFSIIITTSVEQIHDFSLECDSPMKNINPGESVFYHFKINNKGNADDNFTFRVNLSKSNIPESWEIEYDNLNIKVNYTETINISVKATPSIEAKADEKAEIVFEILSTDSIIQDSLTIISIVNQIYEISLEIDKNEQNVKPEQSVEYEITLKNKGNGNDTVRLVLSGQNSNWGYLSESIINLEANILKTITLTVSAPELVIDGEIAKISIQAISENSETSNILLTTTTVKISENIGPNADFKITFNGKEITKARIGEEITFDASSSSDEEGEIVEYQWDFDNGDIRYGDNVGYTYPKDTEPGEYTITLRVTDSNGTTTVKQMTIEVLEEEKETNWLLYLILVVLVVIGILIVIMLNKVDKNLKDLEKGEQPVTPITEKVGVPYLEGEGRKEEQKKKKIEMWKPQECKEEVSFEHAKMIDKESLEQPIIQKEKVQEKQESED